MSEQKENIRVGIVGAGTNTRARHIPGLQNQPGVEIVSVANRRRESAEDAARQFDIPTVYDTWEELVAADDTNAIVIGTWPYLHCPVTLAALEAGKHVLCEARMAMNAAQARAMLEALHKHSELVGQVVPAPFTLEVDATVQRLIAEGYLGQIVALSVRSLSGTFTQPERQMHWREDAELSGLNVLSLGIWYEVLLRWIGPATHVTARGKIVTSRRYDPRTRQERSVQVPEHVSVIAEMACGAQATMEFSSVMGLIKNNEAVLAGTEGTLRFAQGGLSGGRQGDDTLTDINIEPRERGGWRVEEEFVRAIRGQEAVKLTTFEDGLKIMEFTEAVAHSMSSGQTEPVSAQ